MKEFTTGKSIWRLAFMCKFDAIPDITNRSVELCKFIKICTVCYLSCVDIIFVWGVTFTRGTFTRGTFACMYPAFTKSATCEVLNLIMS